MEGSRTVSLSPIHYGSKPFVDNKDYVTQTQTKYRNVLKCEMLNITLYVGYEERTFQGCFITI